MSSRSQRSTRDTHRPESRSALSRLGDRSRLGERSRPGERSWIDDRAVQLFSRSKREEVIHRLKWQMEGEESDKEMEEADAQDVERGKDSFH